MDTLASIAGDRKSETKLPSEAAADFAQSVADAEEAKSSAPLDDYHYDNATLPNVLNSPQEAPLFVPAPLAAIPAPVQHVMSDELEPNTRRLIKTDPVIKAAAVSAVEWVCSKLTPSEDTPTLSIDLPAGTLEFPLIGWQEDGTLLTLLLSPDVFKFQPKYGADLDLIITEGETVHKFPVVYGGGSLRVDGLPIVIISFLVHTTSHGEER